MSRSDTRPDPALPRLLDVERVSVEIHGKKILDSVTFWIPKGEFVCLVGPNGAGKTMLLKAIMGLVPVTSGKITFAGKDVAVDRPAIGYVPQRKGFDRDFPARPIDLIVAALRGRWPVRVTREERERVRGVLARIGGEHLLDRPLAALSGGETQRVFLARALIHDPKLLIFDEPTAGVDARGRAELLDLMAQMSRSEELAAILVTHNLAAVTRIAERIIYLEGGQLLRWGLPGDLLGEESLTALGAFGASDHHAGVADEE